MNKSSEKIAIKGSINPEIAALITKKFLSNLSTGYPHIECDNPNAYYYISFGVRQLLIKI